MSVPDSQLPVFSFRPNWKDGLTERLSWLTNILDSKTAAEQRIALRLTPRRAFIAKLMVEASERTFFDLFLRRFGANEFMLPLWHDRGVTDTTTAPGATALSLDTTDREFVDGGMAILMGPDALSCEAVQIDTVSPTGVTLVGATGGTWLRGTAIHPLRRSRFEDQITGNAETDRLLQGELTFMLSQANAYEGGAEDLTIVDGLPILSPAPDWSEQLDLTWVRKAFNIDNKVGIPKVGDLAGRGFSVQSHRWFLEGRAALAQFYRLLYRLNGRQGALWLPSFQSDLVLAADAAAGATSIDIEAVGLDYIGELVGGRERALTGGGEMLNFSGIAASPGAGVERLNLSTPLVTALSAGAALQFVDVGRLDSDEIEIIHETDSDGVTRTAAPFRTFPDIRDASAAGALELPEATMDAEGCGCSGDLCALEFEFTVTNWDDVVAANDFPGFVFHYQAANGDLIEDGVNAGGAPTVDEYSFSQAHETDSYIIQDTSTGTFRVLVTQPPSPDWLADESQFQFFQSVGSFVVPMEATCRVRRVSVSSDFIEAGVNAYDGVTLSYSTTETWVDIAASADVPPRYYFNDEIASVTGVCPGDGPAPA